jgi:hypothetical protein
MEVIYIPLLVVGTAIVAIDLYKGNFTRTMKWYILGIFLQLLSFALLCWEYRLWFAVIAVSVTAIFILFFLLVTEARRGGP